MRRNTGFTIVELLIVVVVIAILASITIVSYNGIQQKAHNSAILSQADTWLKVISLYNSTNGQLTITDIPNGAEGVCLGDPADYPSTSYFNHSDGDCRSGFYTSSQLTSALNQTSNVRTPNYEIAAGSNDFRRGIQYAIAEDSDELITGHSYLIYDLAGGGQNCILSGIEAVPHSTGSITECTVDLTEMFGAQPIFF